MKKMLGAIAIAGVVTLVVATRKRWVPMLRDSVADLFIWAMDDPTEDEEEPESVDEGSLW